MTIDHKKEPFSNSLSLAVCISWLAQCIQIVSGFVVPRLIEDRLGRELLGIWDLGWSLTSYFMLLEGGIGSAVNRHIAVHLAANDMAGVNRVVSSVAAVQRLIGSLIIGSCIALSMFVENFAKELSPGDLVQARWLVSILGSSIGISLYGAVYTGVLAGCQRWPLHHGIYAFTNVLSIVGMVTALSLGQGLVTLALIHWSTELLGRIIRTIAAYRVCPGLSNRLRNATFATVQQMVSYGGKVYVIQMSQIVMNQTVNVMISAMLGPAFLALYARPRSLVRQAAVFSQKYSFMLVPKAAVLSGSGQRRDKVSFAIESTRNGLYIALPLTALLALSGDNLLAIWMGPDFADHLLVAALAIGFLFEVVYLPLNSILAGMNYHGQTALATLIGATTSTVAAGTLLFAGIDDLSVIAVAVSLPWSITHGIYIPMYACAKLDVPVRRFMLDSWTRPLLCVSPLIACFLAANVVFPVAPIKALLAGGLSGGVLFASACWKWGFPAEASYVIRPADTRDPKRVAV